MPPTDSIVVMGQVLGPFGILGWVRIRPFTEAPDGLLDYAKWWLRAPGAADWREVARLEGRMHSGTVLARLSGVDAREQVLALRGAEVGVARAMLPRAAQDEVYESDLVGLEVVNREGVRLGQVSSVQDYGAHPVLRVRVDGAEAPGERLIPYVSTHIDRVDLAARRIEVDWQPDY